MTGHSNGRRCFIRTIIVKQRFVWYMLYLTGEGGGPLGIVYTICRLRTKAVLFIHGN